MERAYEEEKEDYEPVQMHLSQTPSSEPYKQKALQEHHYANHSGEFRTQESISYALPFFGLPSLDFLRA